MKASFKPGILFAAAIMFLAFNLQACFAGHTKTYTSTVIVADTSLNEEIQNQLDNKILSSRLYFPKSVSRLYATRGFKPAWIKPQTGDGPTWQAMLMIDCVLQYGLSHADYHPDELQYDRLHNILDTPGKVNIQLQARFDIMLTDAILALINNLHFGKLNPEYPGSRIDADTTVKFKAEKTLEAGFLQKDMMSVIDGVQPKAKEYTDMQRRMHLLEGIYQDDCYQVPQAEVRKIAINMERLRWFNTDDSVYIHINIPSYTLKLYFKDTTYKFRVIVGKPASPTPALLSAISYFTTAPEWKIPAKIFRKELLPKIMADPAFLENNHYAIYNNKGKYIEPVAADLAKVKKHPELYFARQSAGCDNALGMLVFRFPNVYEVYLHDTPEQKLFNHEERDLSHGCIRVEQAEKLARLLLINDGSADKIQSMHNGMVNNIKQDFKLKQPLPIRITYLTCGVNEGEYVTYKDVYDLDKRLEMALYGADQNLTAR
jgi:murein L,D-transpeptidase YcbB/YkuD